MHTDSDSTTFRLALAAGLAALGLVAFGCAPQVRVPEADLAITNVTVIDGTGRPAESGVTVLVAAGHIAAIAPTERTEVPETAQILDGSGRFLIPGLWDLHVHAWGPSPFAEIFLRHGITAVREMGTGIEPLWGGNAGVWDWREAVRSGELRSPRVFAAGFILNGGDPDQQGAPFFKGVTSPSQGIEWVETLAERDADFVKIYSALSPETFEAIAETAGERGLAIVGHVPALVGTRAAVDAGLRSLEHLYDFLVATSSEEEAIRREIAAEIARSELPTAAAQSAELSRTDHLLATHDPAKAQELYALFRQRGTWIEPTLAVISDPRCPGSPVAPAGPQDLEDLPAYLHRFVLLPEVEPEELSRDCRRAQRLAEVVAELEDAKVRLLAGSDGPNPGVAPGQGLHDELVRLVAAGLSPARVLRMATLDAAEFMGLAASVGSIETGKAADLVLLDADPLADIRNTRRIARVVLGGELLSRE